MTKIEAPIPDLSEKKSNVTSNVGNLSEEINAVSKNINNTRILVDNCSPKTYSTVERFNAYGLPYTLNFNIATINNYDNIK